MILTLSQVALGGALGASLRHLANVAARHWLGAGFPYGTMIVNVLGSFLMGVLVVALVQKGGTKATPFLMTGVLGGFTTFSAFSLDAITLWERGQVMAAGAYVLLSVLLSLAAIAAGLIVARQML
ncbi:fluoride efflux transporter CrcB [Aliigemmobacter aestuarii]|uniref:Fluoride-specific ion channel FluC n=1 Tax=Aliigemmobacter aestuarii TaxID=1445661 RepID=A0A4S3MRR4_9RHOB|nr:fluoride efflux transporter CrcB [Gemmobacter aestuarii]THD85208.1 fluoride efflux transporter CrcB [Gemmobacter aestuarii]